MRRVICGTNLLVNRCGLIQKRYLSTCSNAVASLSNVIAHKRSIMLDAKAFHSIPTELKTPKFLFECVEANPKVVDMISPKERTIGMYAVAASQQFTHLLGSMPENLKTGCNLKLVHDANPSARTDLLLMGATPNDLDLGYLSTSTLSAFQKLPDKYKTQTMCVNMCKAFGRDVYEHVPNSLLSNVLEDLISNSVPDLTDNGRLIFHSYRSIFSCLQEKVISGSVFHKIAYFKNGKYVYIKPFKLTNSKENHNDFQFQSGFNIDTVPFNPTSTCTRGGLYFVGKQDISNWTSYRGNDTHYKRVVTLPDDAQVYVEHSKFKADKFILGRRRWLWTPRFWLGKSRLREICPTLCRYLRYE